MKRELLPDLMAFAIVAQERSFTRGAGRLGVSTSALSHTIRLLEEKLGARLLHRTTRSVAPTNAGQALLGQLLPALQNIELGLEKLAEDADRPRGPVRINTHRTAALLHVLPKLSMLRTRFPEIAIELAIDDGLTDIVAYGFDAGIRNGEQLIKDMVAVRISPDYRTAVVGSPVYFGAHAKPALPADLGDHACLGYRETTSGALRHWEFATAGQSVKVAIEPVFTCNDGDMLVRAALAGLGLAYVSQLQAEAYLASGALVEVLADWSINLPGSFLYYPSRRQLPPAMRIVIDALRHWAA